MSDLFSPGDRVRVANPELRVAHGTTGTVVTVEKEFCTIRPDDTTNIVPAYYHDELELLQE